jgi:hypothetical protein
MQARSRLPAVKVWLDPDLGLSRPDGDMQPRCSRCAADVDPYAKPSPLILRHDLSRGECLIWIYCIDCTPTVRGLLGEDPG